MLVKNSRKSLLSGLWALPSYEGAPDPERTAAFLSELGIVPAKIRTLPDKKHIFTHVEWQLHGIEVLTDPDAEAAEENLPESARFVSPKELREEIALPEAYRKWKLIPGEN